MNWIGIVPILMGLIYLIYSILRRNKITYYNRRFSRRCDMTMMNLNGFLRSQLFFSILISMLNIILGISIIIFNLNNAFILGGPLILSLINFLLVLQCKMKGYIYYK
jgi:uncharacterized membrane protein SpoIIM required for sporulation